MRNALSISAGACSETSEPKMLLISRLKLISPRLSVTGSIRSSTRRTSRLRQSKTRSSRNGVLRRSQAGIASWIAVPTSTPIA